MNLYLKTRLYQEPFLVHKALTAPNRIAQWIKHQTLFTYTENEGFHTTENANITLIADNIGDDKTIPFTLTVRHLDHGSPKIKKAHFELFYMRSHSQSDKFTDIHFMITELDAEILEQVKPFLTTFLETLRHNYNGNWIITDQELFSSRLF